MTKGKTPQARKGAKPPSQTEEDLRSDWRTPPAQPRKRVRNYSSTTQSQGRADGRRTRGAIRERRPLRVPSRKAILRFLRGFVLVLLVCAVAFGMYELLRLPELAIDRSTAEIGGAQRIPPLRIYEASGVDGRNIFLIRAGEIQDRVLSLPGIARAEVHLRLPNRVIVDVVEHAPLVAWQGITTTVWLAEDGAEVPQAGDLPPLALTDETGVSLGESRRLWPLVLKNMAELHAAQPDVRELFYGKTEGLYYRTADGWAVWLGDSGPMTAKLSLIGDAQQEIASRGQQPKVIDVRLSGRRALYW
jgi:hypothetical protein